MIKNKEFKKKLRKMMKKIKTICAGEEIIFGFTLS